MTRTRAALLVILAAVGAYANSIGNGFAYDDLHIIQNNPAVTSPSLGQTAMGSYWPTTRTGAGLFRPVAITSFALQWMTFEGAPAGFHAVSVLLHAGASVLLLLLLQTLVPLAAATAGAIVFAVHPVHVEAVANVVGQSELCAALAVLLACYLYLRGAEWVGVRRGARLGAVAVAYLAGLGSKEIAVTLPALLVLLELARTSPEPVSKRLARSLPIHVALFAVLGTYLVLRTAVLGSMTGEVPAPPLRELTAVERFLTALSLWPEYMRLLLFPLDLAADYAPAVIMPATHVDATVLAGAFVIFGLGVLAWVLRRRVPAVSLGIGWFCVAILPVSNLFFPVGVMMAERTLYLPSMGLAIAVAGVTAHWLPSAARPARARAAILGLAVCAALMVRTVLRNPTWLDTFTVLNTLAVEHPESYLALRSRGLGLAGVGDFEDAQVSYEAALALAPRAYSLLVEVAQFYGSRGQYTRAIELARTAVEANDEAPEAYLLLSEYLIRAGQAREGHAAALTGLARGGPDARLFALVSEAYVAKGDLEAAVRARVAALGQAPESSRDWGRLAELYDMMGRAGDADEARERAAELPTR